jgi:hypothetical protein
LLIELSYQPSYDQAHPDYGRYAETFRRLSVPISRRGITSDDAIDLSELNGGKWQVACVFGGYTNPLEAMRAFGANIDEKDQLRLTEAGSRGFRLAQVEESDGHCICGFLTTTPGSSTSSMELVLRGSIFKSASADPRHASYLPVTRLSWRRPSRRVHKPVMPASENLVWGLGSQAENSRHAIFSFNPISLFDLKAHFFVL